MSDTCTSNIPVAHDGSTSHASNVRGQLIDRSLLHTAQAYILARDGLDLIVNHNSKTEPKRISHWHTVDNGTMATFRLNPNNEVIPSPASGNLVHLGNCPSLEAFHNICAETAFSEDFLLDDIRFSRVDYAFDNMNLENEDRFRKLGILLGICYAVKHNVPPADQDWFETVTTLEFKGLHIHPETKPIRINLYRKKFQQPKRGINWRLELRFVVTPKNGSRLHIPEDMLNAFVAELKTMSDYFDAAQNELNSQLANKYRELEFDTLDSHSIYQHLQTYHNRVFSREQVRDFYALLTGETDKTILKERGDYFSKKYHRLYVNRPMFERFINELIEHIEAFKSGKKWATDYPFSANETASDDVA